MAFSVPVAAHTGSGSWTAPDGPATLVAVPFAPTRHAALDRFVDLVIPPTDTPGASEAGVTDFIELMYQHWMFEEERQACDRELDQVLAVFAQPGDPVDRLYEAGRFKAPLLRKLTIYGYYTSQIGAAEELELNLAAGHYTSCAVVSEDVRAPSLNTWGIGLNLSLGSAM